MTGTSGWTSTRTKYGVCLVNEDDARRQFLRQGEDSLHVLLAFANPHVIQVYLSLAENSSLSPRGKTYQLH